MQSSVAIVSGLLGIAAWWTTGHALWLAGAILILANWPFTLLAIMPTNHLLHATPAAGDADTRARLIRWGHLHAVRTALSAAATLCYLAAAA